MSKRKGPPISETQPTSVQMNKFLDFIAGPGRIGEDVQKLRELIAQNRERIFQVIEDDHALSTDVLLFSVRGNLSSRKISLFREKLLGHLGADIIDDEEEFTDTSSTDEGGEYGNQKLEESAKEIKILYVYGETDYAEEETPDPWYTGAKLDSIMSHSVAYLREFIRHYEQKNTEENGDQGGSQVDVVDSEDAEGIVCGADMEILELIVSMVSSYLTALSQLNLSENKKPLIVEKNHRRPKFSRLIAQLKRLQGACKYFPHFDLSGDFQTDLRNVIENCDTMGIILDHITSE